MAARFVGRRIGNEWKVGASKREDLGDGFDPLLGSQQDGWELFFAPHSQKRFGGVKMEVCATIAKALSSCLSDFGVEPSCRAWFILVLNLRMLFVAKKIKAAVSRSQIK